MSIDWSVWIEPSYFSVRQLIDRSEEVLTTLLGGGHSLALYHLQPSAPPPHLVRADAALADAPCGSATEPFEIARAEDPAGGAVSVTFVRTAEAIDDPEYGDWLFATPWRTPLSYVLGIAVGVAAAMLAGQYLIDDGLVLGGGREREPGDVLARLALPTPGLALAEAVNAVLERTQLAARGGRP